MIRKALLVAASVMLFNNGVLADPVAVDSIGSGATREEAVAHALANAVAQVSGVSITAMQASSMKLATQASDDRMTVNLSKESQTDVQMAAGGWIRNFRIDYVRSIDNGRLEASVQVTVELFKARTAGADSRRRITVSVVGDGTVGSQEALLRDKIISTLVQTRRFAVLDRSNQTAYRAEMSVLQGGDVPLTERVRIGQVLGTDYLLIARLHQTAGTRSEKLIPATGEVIVSSTPATMDVNFQVIEIATRQVAWAGAIRGSGIDKAADRITSDIAGAIYPIRMIRFDDPAALIINQGGVGIQKGQRLAALRLGEDLEDPDTLESLGKIEIPIATIEITRVETRVSYARLVSGKLPKSDETPTPQLIVRRLPAQQPIQQSVNGHRGPTAEKDQPIGGVRLPFDK